jgi:hypothetical protein
MLRELEQIAYLVRDTVKALPKDFDRGKEICMGADGTPTLSIDKIAEDVILKAVNDMDLPVNVLSEEAVLVDRGYADTLVVDPHRRHPQLAMNVPMLQRVPGGGHARPAGGRHAVLWTW